MQETSKADHKQRITSRTGNRRCHRFNEDTWVGVSKRTRHYNMANQDANLVDAGWSSTIDQRRIEVFASSQ
jgi:hypothetical protein